MLLASTSRPANRAAASSPSRTAVPRSLCRAYSGMSSMFYAESDHRRLVTDGVDAANRPRDRGAIGDVALDQLGLRIEVVGPFAVGGRQQADRAPARRGPSCTERVDDVRADETGAAGDEDHALHATVAGSPGKGIGER